MTPHDLLDPSDPLAALRDAGTSASVPPVADVQRRGRAILRARRTRRVAGAGVLAVGLVVGGVSLPQIDHGGPVGGTTGGFLGVAPASASDGGACDANTGYGSWIDRDDWGKHRDVVAAMSVIDGLGAPRNAGVHVDTMTCPTLAPAAVLYDTAPVRGITVWRDVANPYGDQAHLVDEQVRGRTGLLTELDGGTHVLSWQDADGVRWLAEAGGLPVPTMVRALDTLTFTDGVVDPASVPGAFEVAAPVGQRSSRTTRGWEATYGDGSWDRTHVDLRAAALADPPESFASTYPQAVTFTKVSGTTAVFVRESDDWAEMYWVRDGIRYVVAADGDLARLTSLAEHVRTARVGDGALSGVPDPRAAPQQGR